MSLAYFDFLICREHLYCCTNYILHVLCVLVVKLSQLFSYLINVEIKSKFVILIHEKMEQEKQGNQCRISLSETDSCLMLSKLLYVLFFNLIIKKVNYARFGYCLICKSESH